MDFNSKLRSEPQARPNSNVSTASEGTICEMTNQAPILALVWECGVAGRDG
jgi:hypothetical protein